jgi:hypothetical protein
MFNIHFFSSFFCAQTILVPELVAVELRLAGSSCAEMAFADQLCKLLIRFALTKHFINHGDCGRFELLPRHALPHQRLLKNPLLHVYAMKPSCGGCKSLRQPGRTHA